MATAALVSNTVLSNVPYLVRKITYTGGATLSSAITHGEFRAPDLILSTSTDATNHDVNAACVDRTSATTIKIATVVDTARTGELYLVWFPQGSTGSGLDPA